MSETHTQAELVAAYARMRAEGDDAGCQKLRRMMAGAKGEKREFADVNDAPQQPAFDERAHAKAQFEKAIDANPLDTTSQRAYSDWLRENGEQDEGDFRHTLADWLEKRPQYQSPYDTREGEHLPWMTHPSFLPEGVDKKHVATWSPAGRRLPYVQWVPDEPHQAVAVSPGFRWQTYRGMEEGLRRAFMATRNLGKAFATDVAPGGGGGTMGRNSSGGTPVTEPAKRTFSDADLAKPRPPSRNLAALFKQARQDPYEETGHGVIADALDEEHPGNHIGHLIREQFGLGEHAGKRRDNDWYEPVENSWYGTFPYAARLGAHGPFDLYLRHEGQPQQNQKWVVHAVARVNRRPELNDFGYTFEFGHDEAHRVSRMFPAATKYIHPGRDMSGDWTDEQLRGPRVMATRDREAREFEQKMDAEETARQ